MQTMNIESIKFRPGICIYVHHLPGGYKEVSDDKEPMVVGDRVLFVGKIGQNGEMIDQDMVWLDDVANKH